MQELLEQDKRLFWMPAEGLDVLNSCFGLEVETLEGGDTRGSAGRIGYLLQGEASIQTDRGAEQVSGSGLVGIRLGGPRDCQRDSGVITALSECKVLWMPYDVMEFACHRNCWFHTRLMLTIRQMLEEQDARSLEK